MENLGKQRRGRTIDFIDDKYQQVYNLSFPLIRNMVIMLIQLYSVYFIIAPNHTSV